MIDLTPYNTLRIPAGAQNLRRITSKKALLQEFRLGSFKKPHLFLGHGANVLFTRDFPGTVFINQTAGKKIVAETDSAVSVEFASGEDWEQAVLWSVKNNWSGMENMALIPGTIGAAAVGNIAAYGQNQQDIFNSLTAVNLTTGKSRRFSFSDMHFSYRESILKNELAGEFFVTSVTYNLSKTAHLELSYHAARHASLLPELEKIAKPPYTLQNIADAVINLRTAKLPDVRSVHTAGSFFKNPVVARDVADRLREKIPDLQTYPPDKLSYQDPGQTNNLVKLPAGMLLDELGWKGKIIGHVGTFATHALIVVTSDGATGREVFEFSEMMRNDVQKHFGVNLEYEVVVI